MVIFKTLTLPTKALKDDTKELQQMDKYFHQNSGSFLC